MFGKILSHSWLAFRRSPAFTQNLVTTIIMGLFGLYLLLCFLVLGGAAPFIIEDTFPDANGPLLFGRYFMYFILYLFLSRLIFQNFGFQSLKQYLLQKIPKRSLFHFLLLKTGINWMNTIPILGIITYLITSGFAEDYSYNRLHHGLVLIGLLYASNFLAFLFDKQLSINKIATGILIASLVLLNFLDVKGYIPLGDAFEASYAFLVSNIGTALIPLGVLVASYFFSFKSLEKVAYLEDNGTDASISSVGVKSGIFSRFGKAGELMEMEIKLILRNKRSRNMLFITPLMLIYPLIIHGQGDHMNGMGWMMFVGIFCTGGFAMTYGQLLLSWNSDHFDLLLTKMTSIREIFKAKYYLQCIFVFTQGVIMILWGFYKSEYFYLMPAMMFYNVGIVLFMYMIHASYNAKKINSNKGSAMNTEGVSLALFLIIIPIMILPMAFYYGFNMIGQPLIGILILAMLGLLGFVFHEKLIDISVNLFMKNRHKIGAAFRKK